MTSFREWLKTIRRYHTEYEPIVVGDLLAAYEGTNGTDDRRVFDDLVAKASADEANKMRTYYCAWEKESARPRKGEKDPLDRVIRRIYILTERFVIYSVDDPDSDDDVCGIHYALADSYDDCKVLRGRLNAVAPQLSYVTDAVTSMRPVMGSAETFRRFRERIFEMLAVAMASALEDQPARAQQVIDQARTSAEDRRNSVNRMRYMGANTCSAALVLVVGLCLMLFSETLPPLPEFLSVGQGADAESLPILPVLMAGALGSFFSVALSLRDLKVSWTITLAEVLFSGFARIWIGVIAAGAVIWIVDGKWLLAAVEDGSMPATVLLLGFIAGFSEMFVPNALETIEDQAQVRQRGTATETRVEVVQTPRAVAPAPADEPGAVVPAEKPDAAAAAKTEPKKPTGPRRSSNGNPAVPTETGTG